MNILIALLLLLFMPLNTYAKGVFLMPSHAAFYNKHISAPPAITPPIYYVQPQLLGLSFGDRIMFAGDSITAGGAQPGGFIYSFNQALQQRHPELDITVMSAGIPGNTSSDLWARFKTDVLAYQPSVVVILIGVNDVGTFGLKGQTPAQMYTTYYNNLTNFFNACRSTMGVRKIIFMTPLCINECYDGQNWADGYMDQMAVYTRAFTQYGVGIVDLRAFFDEDNRSYNPGDLSSGMLTIDGVHPFTTFGNSTLTSLLLKAFGD